MEDPIKSEKEGHETSEITTHKTWYRRRRYVLLIVFVLLIYFCLVPSRLRITPETTGLADPPLMRDGMPDYFADYEKSWIDKLTPPEDNGQRLLIAAFGPRVLEQIRMVEDYSWEEIPTGEYSKLWFEKYWLPLCEAMYIDPYAKPGFYDSQDFSNYVRKRNEARKESGEEIEEYYKDREADRALLERLSTEPWSAERYPEIASWLEGRNPALDLFGIAVRKQNFAAWRKRPNEGGCCMILLPDVQAVRTFARDLGLRISGRVDHGDLDGAWHDMMSLFLLSRKHLQHDDILVVNLVGMAVEKIGYRSLQTILKYGKPTAEQLGRFAADLYGLPRRSSLNYDREKLIEYDVLYQIARGDRTLLDPDLFGSNDFRLVTLKYLSYLPFDLNIAGKRIAKFHRDTSRSRENVIVPFNSVTVIKHLQRREEKLRQIERNRTGLFRSILLKAPLIRTRSELIADYIICCFAPTYSGVENAFKRANTHFALAEIALALERYERAEGRYPESLQTLVPKYLEEIPLDPFTDRKTLTYRPGPDRDSPYLLYSYGPDGKDNDGTAGIPEDRPGSDIVFQR